MNVVGILSMILVLSYLSASCLIWAKYFTDNPWQCSSPFRSTVSVSSLYSRCVVMWCSFSYLPKFNMLFSVVVLHRGQFVDVWAVCAVQSVGSSVISILITVHFCDVIATS